MAGCTVDKRGYTTLYKREENCPDLLLRATAEPEDVRLLDSAGDGARPEEALLLQRAHAILSWQNLAIDTLSCRNHLQHFCSTHTP